MSVQTLDGALVAVISDALHQRCTNLGIAEHRPDAHDHGARDVAAALRRHGWICTHGPTGTAPRNEVATSVLAQGTGRG
jgi:hypothetical protein